MSRRINFVLVVLGLFALLSVVGCGSDSGAADEPVAVSDSKPDPRLLELVSAAISSSKDVDHDFVEYADFAEARRQLGLADDEGVYEPPLSFMSSSLIYSSKPVPTSPLMTAIDGRLIQESASRGGLHGYPALVAIRTTQPFGEIAAALQKEGYATRGDVLVSRENMAKVIFPVVADAGDGVVVLGGDEDFVKGVLADRNPSLSPAVELIDDVPGPARAALSPKSKCVVAGAAGQNISPRDGELLLQVEGTPSAAKLSLPDVPTPTSSDSVEFDEPEVEDDLLRTKFSYVEGGLPNYPNIVIDGLALDGSTYDC